MSASRLAAVKKLSFGLEELLAPGAQVYFENVFSTRHMGRVVDLMLFQSQGFVGSTGDAAQTEYRIRQTLDLAIFSAWTNYRRGEKVRCVEIEFGWDESKLVFSVSHAVDSDVANFAPGAAPANETSTRMQKMLVQIQSLTDGLIIRHDTAGSRVQVIAFLSVNQTERLAEPQYLDLAQFPPEEPAPESPALSEAQPPEELSNADIETFIADENAAPPEMPVEEPPPPEPVDDKITVSGWKEEVDTTETVIKPDAPEEEVVTKIAAGPKEGPLEKITVSGGDAKPEKEQVTVVKGQATKPEKEQVTVFKGGGDSKPQREQVTVFKGGATSKPEKAPVMVVKGGGGAPEAKGESRRVPLAVVAAQSAQPSGPSRREQFLQDQVKTLHEQIEKLKVEKQEAVLKALAESANDLDADIEKSRKAEAEASEAIGKYEKELKNDEVPENTKEWAKGLMENVVKERAELSKRSREIDALLRKREHEFKTKEISFREQLKGLDEQLRQKEAAHEKSKETISSLSGTLDKLRSTTNDAQEKVELAHKLVTAEKLLERSKDEVERYQKRAEEAQRKANEEMTQRTVLMQENLRQKKQLEDQQRKLNEYSENAKLGSSAEVNLLIEQRDKANRFVEELKRQNRELQSKISAAAAAAKPTSGKDGGKDGGKAATGNEAELKHKLEIANSLAKASKDELEKSKKRMEETKAQEAKMRGEISKLQAEVAKLQSELKAAGLKTAQTKTAQANAAAAGAAATKAKPKG